MAGEVWRKCPVDGTRFWYRTEAFPLGRHEGARYCSGGCAAQAGGESGKQGAFYNPEVDGTLGSGTERTNGGPVHFHGFDVRPRREFVSFPSDGVTARPKGGGDLGEYSDLVEGYATGAARGGRS